MNPKFHYSIYKCPPPVPILSQINPVRAHHPTSWRSILILSPGLCLGLPSGLFPSVFLTKSPYAPHFSPICAICPVHLILLEFFTRIFGEEGRILKVLIMHSSPLSCYLVPRTAKWISPHIAGTSEHPQPILLPQCEDPVSHPYKTTGKMS